MKLIVAGSRDITDEIVVRCAIDFARLYLVRDSKPAITELVSGACEGVDRCAEAYAQYEGMPVTQFPADWDRHGKAAGPLRNAEMAKYADAALILRYPESKGSLSMAREARAAGIPMIEIEVPG